MTCNKLIALLECYLTGRPRGSGLGGIMEELYYLRNRGLIEAGGVDEWHVTYKGRIKVEALLVLMS